MNIDSPNESLHQKNIRIFIDAAIIVVILQGVQERKTIGYLTIDDKKMRLHHQIKKEKE